MYTPIPYDVLLSLHRLVDVVTRERLEHVLGWERKVYEIRIPSTLTEDTIKERQNRMTFETSWFRHTFNMGLAFPRPNRPYSSHEMMTWTSHYIGDPWKRDPTTKKWKWDLESGRGIGLRISERMRTIENGYGYFIYWRDTTEVLDGSGQIEENSRVKTSFTMYHLRLFKGVHPCS